MFYLECNISIEFDIDFKKEINHKVQSCLWDNKIMLKTKNVERYNNEVYKYKTIEVPTWHFGNDS